MIRIQWFYVGMLGLLIHSVIVPQAENGRITYYQRLDLPERAQGDEIRRACAAKQFELKKKKEWFENDYKKHPTSQLKAAINKLDEQIKALDEACITLQNPLKRRTYDEKLAKERFKERLKEEREKLIRNYCQEQEQHIQKDLEVKIGWVQQEQRLTREANSPSEKISEINAEIEQLNQKITEIERDCKILADPDNPQFEETFKKVTEVQKQEEKETKGIFSKIKGAIGSNADVKIFAVLGEILSRIPIPDAATKVFNQNVAIRNMQFVAVTESLLPENIDPAEIADALEATEKPIIPLRISGMTIRKGLGFTGTLMFNNVAVKATGIVIQDVNRTMQFSLAIDLPAMYKISSMFPSFKKLDILSLPKGTFTI